MIPSLQSLPLGPLRIPFAAAALLAGAGIAWAGAILWRKRGSGGTQTGGTQTGGTQTGGTQRKGVTVFFGDAATEGLLFFFLFAKLGSLLLQPGTVFSDPAGFLAAPLGTAGTALGSLAALLWIAFRVTRFYCSRTEIPNSEKTAGLVLLTGLFAGGGLMVYVAGLLLMPASAEEKSSPWTRRNLEALSLPPVTVPGTAGAEPDWDAPYLVVNAWATWCPPCRGELPELQQFAAGKEPGDTRAELVGVNMTRTEESLRKVRDFIRDKELIYPILLDAEGKFQDMARPSALPTTWVFDEEGTMKARKSGTVTARWIRKQIEEMTEN